MSSYFAIYVVGLTSYRALVVSEAQTYDWIHNIVEDCCHSQKLTPFRRMIVTRVDSSPCSSSTARSTWTIFSRWILFVRSEIDRSLDISCNF